MRVRVVDEKGAAVNQAYELHLPGWTERSLGEVLGGPGVLRPRERLARQPDVFFVSNEHLGRVREQYVSGAADFVIEVVSEGGRTRDLEEKAGEYEAAGVPEYWLVDAAAREVIVHRLSGSAREGRRTGGSFVVETTTVGGRLFEKGDLGVLAVRVVRLRTRCLLGPSPAL